MARKPKAPLPAWVIENRKRLKLKPEGVAARVGVAPTTVRGWETGRGIKPENIEALEKLFGLAAPDAPEPADLAALVGAISELAAEIRLSRAEEAVTRQEMMRALAALASGRALPGKPAEAERDSPEGVPA